MRRPTARAPLATVLLALSTGGAAGLRRQPGASEDTAGHAAAGAAPEANRSSLQSQGTPLSKLAAASEGAGTWQGSLFVFGYGSLLKEMSRIKTTCNLTSVSESTLDFLDKFAWVTKPVRECIESVRSRTMILVKAKGVRRGWYDTGRLQAEAQGELPWHWATQALDLSPTFLGAVADPTSECYGVVYPVSQEELALTDQREATYGTISPQWIAGEHIEVLSPGYELPRGASVRWYELSQDRLSRPTRQHPICQSYVDVFVGGALELAKAHNCAGYARDVVLSTFGWSKHWVNDRIVPYRPYVHESKAHQIVRTLVQAARLPGSPLALEHLAGVQFPSGSGRVSGREPAGDRSGSHPQTVGFALGYIALALLPTQLLHGA
eukprot:CAMPEP_0204546630 /NCGR_PEP_ID=MMETSP0661-20131031/22181_1 /ASSEMBLY_ACC=CAM_ASM_000606 /TAXON_ID=109239 /ORGANISM="Alexandrium margalefi, Strain AMGDE01CS-322" /LENGTH=379 /DNA_ID=CAMNT_0051553467 /DNA_START=1 /DNA_END=1140 /DNA_ORIENTATION=+